MKNSSKKQITLAGASTIDTFEKTNGTSLRRGCKAFSVVVGRRMARVTTMTSEAGTEIVTLNF